MADAKAKPKPGAKPAEGGGSSPGLELIFWIVLVVFFLSLLPGLFGAGSGEELIAWITAWFAGAFPTMISISVFLSLIFGILILLVKNFDGNVKDQALAALAPRDKNATTAEDVVAPMGRPNERWQNVLKHIESDNPSEWRLAIIEADIILEDMLRKMGYQGETLGDLLKGIERSDFGSLDLAWEAHKVRNSIAHQGGDFVISHDEAKRVIGLFKQVFEEFYFI